MQLTNENYYTQEANKTFMSVSTYKNFSGTLYHKGCEAQAMAILNGDYKREPNTAMLIGSYVDAYVEGTLDKFKEKTAHIKYEHILYEKWYDIAVNIIENKQGDLL